MPSSRASASKRTSSRQWPWIQRSARRTGLVVVARAHGQHREAGLALARHVEHERLRALARGVAAREPVDEVEREVERRVHAAAAVDAVLLGDEIVGLPARAREARAALVDERPVRGGGAAVEQARRAEQRDARAHARHARAARVALAQEVDDRRVARDHLGDRQPARGHEHEVAVRDRVERVIGLDPVRRVRAHGRAVDRRAAHAEARRVRLAGAARSRARPRRGTPRAARPRWRRGRLRGRAR